MVITNQHQQAGLGTAGQEVPHPAAGDDARPMAARLTTEQVWHQIAEASFAVIGYVTPAGEPRSSGVAYKSIGRRLYVAVASDSWKASHIAASRRVAVTVPVRRGGILSLVAPIPPATVSFHATAIVHPAGSPHRFGRC
jgi:Pyridoxamine 5'-phosphate oxidase